LKPCRQPGGFTKMNAINFFCCLFCVLFTQLMRFLLLARTLEGILIHSRKWNLFKLDIIFMEERNIGNLISLQFSPCLHSPLCFFRASSPQASITSLLFQPNSSFISFPSHFSLYINCLVSSGSYHYESQVIDPGSVFVLYL